MLLPAASGMQKHGLTMFRLSCYSSLVPRVNPSLLYAVSFPQRCGSLQVELFEKYVFGFSVLEPKTFLAEMFLRCLSPSGFWRA
jgi:hypothetical protein